MAHAGVLDLIAESDEVKSLVVGIKLGKRAQLARGVSGSQKAVLAATLYRKLSRPLVLVTGGWSEMDSICADLGAFFPEHCVLSFPPLDPLVPRQANRTSSSARQRLRALEILHAYHEAPGETAEPFILVAPAAAFMFALSPPGVFERLFLDLKPGKEVDVDGIPSRLIEAGYERRDLVEEPGSFAIRGSIIDVFPPSWNWPLRIELEDDRILSIRQFDPVSQRSTRKVGGASIPPSAEIVAGAKSTERGPARSGTAHSLFDHIPDDAVLFVDEPERAKSEYETAYEAVPDDRRQDDAIAPEEFWARLVGFRCIYATSLDHAVPGTRLDGLVNFKFMQARSFMGRWGEIVAEVRRSSSRGGRTLLFTSSAERGTTLVKALFDEGIATAFYDDLGARPEEGGVYVLLGTVAEGFEMPGLRLLALGEANLYGRARTTRKRLAFREVSYRALRVEDLKPGECVVHVNHGIGRYLGIKPLEIAGTRRDYLFIQYAGADALYVPTDQIHVIQKYVGPEGQEPKLSRLGSQEWSRLKSRVKDSVRDMAQELLKLYAARRTVEGHAFSPDTPWQREFEEAFPFEETPDQIQAAEEIKRDMESKQPMDRLLCGDVGYGKTEVAMRAAFKAVMDSKQVAVLVPTTILALQHHQTFLQRFSGYPVRVDVLTRMKSQREQADCLKRLKSGAIDIVIGTHRLLQDDVVFHDLGLLIVDEEHRFGVAHKEKIKKIKQNVDVLAMSATPIPRTLHMALSGLRDMSVMETPPEDRFPVETYVIEYDEDVIRAAMERELARGGQVYYVHNRVETISAAAARVLSLLPGAKVAIAHGQMSEDQLESVMVDFLEGKYDVLVSTTIIESGLDIANVNTLIVEDADRLGLSQLYQLRGRVGRSNRPGFAYLTYRPGKVLNEAGQKRLEAIRDFADLGSGFKIAMRDLEIRGAGNLLGPEQHGFVAAVGLDLYCQMLEEAISELKGKALPPRIQVSVEMPVDAYIPPDYIPDSRQKIEVYKRIAAIGSLEDAGEAFAEVVDRFGRPPEEVQTLFAIARVKVLARDLGVKSVTVDGDKAVFRWSGLPGVPIDPSRVLGKEYRGRIYVTPGRPGSMVLRCDGMRPCQALGLVEATLRKLHEAGKRLAAVGQPWKK